MSIKKSKNNTEEDYRLGMVIVRALVGTHFSQLNRKFSPETFLEEYLGDIKKSPILEKLFKQALKTKGYLPGIKTNHDTSLSVAVLINQKEFESIVNVIGKIYLNKHNKDLLEKTVNYKGHLYVIYLSQGKLDMPETTQRDKEAWHELRLEWPKQIQKENRN